MFGLQFRIVQCRWRFMFIHFEKEWHWSFTVSWCKPCRPTSPHTIISSAWHQLSLKWSLFSLLSSILLDELHCSDYSKCEMSWAIVVLLGQLCLSQRKENESLGVLLDWLEIGNRVWTWEGESVFRQMCMCFKWIYWMTKVNNMWCDIDHYLQSATLSLRVLLSSYLHLPCNNSAAYSFRHSGTCLYVWCHRRHCQKEKKLKAKTTPRHAQNTLYYVHLFNWL